MFMRLLQLKIEPDSIEIFRRFYDNTVTSELQKVTGCLFANLIESSHVSSEFISMTLWDSQEHAESYEKKEVFQKLLQQAQPYFAESSEWRVELSKDLELQYVPVPEEPLISGYVVSAQSEIPAGDSQPCKRMYVRLVSAKIKMDKLQELRTIYNNEIIPALISIKGCCYAYLIEGKHEKTDAISVTIWDSQKDAEDYEKSGLFNHLIDKVKHTFSDLYQWKMTLEKDFKGQIQTSEELSVDRYKLVSGQRFI